MNILTLKISDKYGPEYVNRLYKALRKNSTVDFDFYCYTENSTGLHYDIKVIPLFLKDRVQKQWYKIDFHHMPEIQGKCLILDIDYIVLNNVDDILNWDLPQNQFGCNYRWWSNRVSECHINGGFQMFYQGTTKHLYDTFYKDPEYWQKHYIKIGEAEGPVNGEQNFIHHNVQLERDWLPMEWFGKMCTGGTMEYVQVAWMELVDSSSVFYMDGEFDERVKMVHFSNSDNMIENYAHGWIKDYWYD